MFMGSVRKIMRGLITALTRPKMRAAMRTLPAVSGSKLMPMRVSAVSHRASAFRSQEIIRFMSLLYKAAASGKTGSRHHLGRPGRRLEGVRQTGVTPQNPGRQRAGTGTEDPGQRHA